MSNTSFSTWTPTNPVRYPYIPRYVALQSMLRVEQPRNDKTSQVHIAVRACVCEDRHVSHLISEDGSLIIGDTKRLKFTVNNALRVVFGEVGASKSEFDLVSFSQGTKENAAQAILRVQHSQLHVVWGALTMCTMIDSKLCKLQVLHVSSSLLGLASPRAGCTVGMSRHALPKAVKLSRLISTLMSATRSNESLDPPADVRSQLQHILMLPDRARTKADYEYLDRYVHNASFLANLPQHDRLRYLRVVKGVELESEEELFHVGDLADAFYCIMYGSLNVLVDFTHVTQSPINLNNDTIDRARMHSSLLHGESGGTTETTQPTSYVVRCMKKLECFGDVGLMISEQLRTASVVANEPSLCMKIDRDAFLGLRKSNIDWELREKIKFLGGILAFEHWDGDNTLKLMGRMEQQRYVYNDVIVKEGDLTADFYLIKHGECRLVKRYPTIRTNNEMCYVDICTLSSRNYFGMYEVLMGLPRTEFSVLISSPTAILYRIDRVDFRQTILKDTLTEQIMQYECLELTKRMDVNRVEKDLINNSEWIQFKREIVQNVLEKHQREHGLGIIGPRSPRPYHSVLHPSSTSITKSPRHKIHQHSSRQTKDGGIIEVLPKRNVNGDSGSTESAPNRATDSNNDTSPIQTGRQELKSNIQWSKSSRIMGGMQVNGEKVTSTIISLFSTTEFTD